MPRYSFCAGSEMFVLPTLRLIRMMMASRISRSIRLTHLPNVRNMLLDVTKDDDMGRVMNMIHSTDPSTHSNDADPLPLTLMGVFNNAGVSKLRTLEFEDPAAVRWQYEVNVMGPQRLTRADLPLLRETDILSPCAEVSSVARASPRIAFTGSIAGVSNAPARIASYSGTKHAVEGMADSLRSEFEEMGDWDFRVGDPARVPRHGHGAQSERVDISHPIVGGGNRAAYSEV